MHGCQPALRPPSPSPSSPLLRSFIRRRRAPAPIIQASLRIHTRLRPQVSALSRSRSATPTKAKAVPSFATSPASQKTDTISKRKFDGMGSTEYPPRGNDSRTIYARTGYAVAVLDLPDQAAAGPSGSARNRGHGSGNREAQWPQGRHEPTPSHAPQYRAQEAHSSANIPSGPRGFGPGGGVSQPTGGQGSGSQPRSRGNERAKSRGNSNPTASTSALRSQPVTGQNVGPSRGQGLRVDPRSASSTKPRLPPALLPFFRDAATGIDILLPPIGKAWHPGSKSLNGRNNKTNRAQQNVNPEEVEQARLFGLKKLKDMLETQFLSEFQGNEDFVRGCGYDLQWRQAVDRDDLRALRKVKAKAIGAQVRRFWERNRSTPGEEARRADLCQRIENLLASQWPREQIRVRAFGSTATGMAFHQSDLDLCILDPGRGEIPGDIAPSICEQMMEETQQDLPAYYKVRTISNVLRSARMFSEIVAITGAKVPIVKYIDRATEISGDINVNNRFGVINSALISAYCDIRPELVRPLICFVKQCFKHWGFNDPAGANGPATFNSYTLALLVINFLQRRNYLPNLQDATLLTAYGVEPRFLFHPGAVGSRNGPKTIIPAETAYDTTFLDWRPSTGNRDKSLRNLFAAVDELCGVQLIPEPTSREEHDQLLGECFTDFLRSFAKTKWRSDFVCSARATLYSLDDEQPFRSDERKAFKERAKWYNSFPQHENGEPIVEMLHETYELPTAWQGHYFIVQDPFIVTRNTAGNVKEEVALSIIKTVDAMRQLLKDDSMTKDVKRIRAQTRIPAAASRRPTPRQSDPSSASTLMIPNLAEICRPMRYDECVSSWEELQARQQMRQTQTQTQTQAHTRSGQDGPSGGNGSPLSIFGAAASAHASSSATPLPPRVDWAATQSTLAPAPDSQRRRHRK
ncbi:hypothetical protein CF335_g2812 [Tilletia laevis]|nr:hypothetical protein CF335_g2812 [Tilletia laevis]